MACFQKLTEWNIFYFIGAYKAISIRVLVLAVLVMSIDWRRYDVRKNRSDLSMGIPYCCRPQLQIIQVNRRGSWTSTVVLQLVLFRLRVLVVKRDNRVGSRTTP